MCSSGLDLARGAIVAGAAVGGFCFFFKQKTADEVGIVTGGSDVCSSDLRRAAACSFLTWDAKSERRRRSEERRVGKSVDLGGRCTIKKKNKWQNSITKIDPIADGLNIPRPAEPRDLQDCRSPPSQYTTHQHSNLTSTHEHHTPSE